MSVIKVVSQKACCFLYLLVGNKLTDLIFWRAVTTPASYRQKVAIILRYFQIGALNYLEGRFDDELSSDVLRKLSTLTSWFRRNTKRRLTYYSEKHFEDDLKNVPPVIFSNSVSLSEPTTPKLVTYPAISIVTPNYNQGKFLEKCIQSVLSQNYPNLEYIIIDGGSTDNSIEIIKKYENEITFWVSEKDNGQADAINKGLKHATGEIFNWLNSDDYLEPGALFRCAEAYMSNPSAVGWVGGCRRIDPEGRVLSVIYPHSFDRENIGQNWYGTQFYQPSCFLSTRKVKQLGGLNPELRIALDLDLWIRLLEKGEFVSGKEIWSNAIIHADAKTQRLGSEVSLETSKVQRKYGFLGGANVRDKMATKKGKFRYTQTAYLKNRLKFIKDSSKIRTGILKTPTAITFISDAFPCYDRKWSDLRLFTILKILLANKCTITYIYTSNKKCPNKYIKALKGDINVFHVTSNHGYFMRILDENKSEYVWITPSMDINQIKFITKFVGNLKEKLNIPIILIDTDHQYMAKFFKSHTPVGNQHGLMYENRYFESTKLLFELADNIVVSNVEDKKHIEETLGLKRNAEVVPNVYRILNSGIPFRKRQNICFFDKSNFNHNMAVSKLFLDDILPYICRKNPSMEFHVIRNNSKKFRDDPWPPNVKVISGVTKLVELLANYKLYVFPSVQGSWGNDGIGIAAGAGLPIVTSTIGAEGYPITDGEECFISDSPEEFREKCNQCLRDTIAWHNFRIKSQLMIAENYSAKAVARKLGKLLSK